MGDGRAIIKAAYDQLRSTISTQDALTFSNASFADVWKVARDIEREQGARTALRNIGRIEPMLRTIETYAPVIDTFCQGFSPMAFVWGPIKFMLLLARQYESIMNKILQALKDIADVLPVMDKMKAAFGNSLDLQRVLGLIYSDILEFITRVYKFLSRRAWHIYFAFDWGLFERRFRSILERLAAHCELLNKEAAATHYVEMRKMRDERHLENEEYERQRHNRMARDVFEWLAAAEDDQDEYLHRLADTRQLGTCDWVLENDKVFSWIEDEKGESFLWMTGIPGAGKSFLCSFIVDHLRTHKDQTTLYYFCGQTSAQHNLSTIYRTLTVQMLRQNLDMVPPVYEALCQKGWSRSSQIIKAILQDGLANVNSSRLILDGVDECDRTFQKEILNGVVGIHNHAGDACKILVASRLEPQITKALPKKGTHLTLDGKTTEALHKYIRNRVEHLKAWFPGLGSVQFDRVEQRMQEMAGGMFLWVRLVTTMLEQQSSELEFEDAIEQLPDGLDEAYRRILSHIESLGPVVKQRALRVLFWVCVAYRPVKIYEVADGIVLKPEQRVLDKRTRISDLDRDVLEICAPIVARSSGGYVGMVHFSAKEYLLHRQSGPFIKIAEAHFAIAFSCIINLTAATAILSSQRFNNVATQPELEGLVVQGSYGLQNYGYHFWAEHVQAYFDNSEAQDDHSTKLLEVLEALTIVQKDRSMNRALDAMSLIPRQSAGGLHVLMQNPSLYTLVMGQLRLKTDLISRATDFEDVQAQEEWQIRNDETFLSLINQSLRNITERILRWSPSELPSNISKDDYVEFMARFGFACRYYKCDHSFDSAQERDAHEGHHIPTFPCDQCDFSGRGFRWKKDLERHKRHYHMSADDFEVPSSLGLPIGGLDSITSGSQSRCVSLMGRSQCWNAKGREIMQRSFTQALDKVLLSMPQPVGESDVRCAIRDKSVKISDTAEEIASNTIGQSDIVENIRQKIVQEQYQRLSDFKDDIRRVIDSRSDTTSRSTEDRGLESICDQEIMRFMSDVPAFANFGSDKGRDFQGELVVGVSEASLCITDNSTYPAGEHRYNGRMPYWSLTEEGQFPKLIERYGRDFVKLSDSLKTKTVDEIEEHFDHLLSSGKQDFLSVVNDLDARVQFEIASNIEHVVEPLEPLSAEESQEEVGRTEDPHLDNERSKLPQSESAENWQESDNNYLRSVFNPNKYTAIRSATEREDKPKKRRRPRQRAFCKACSRQPEGFLDESALDTHTKRFHKSTRIVWIGKDVSIDREFLASCRACTIGTRYLSKHSAFVHLRKYHFSPETPIQTLGRWMEELDEPNPVYNNPAYNNRNPDPPSVRGPDRWPRLSEIITMQKTNESLQLTRITEPPSDTNSPSVDTETKPTLSQPKLGPPNGKRTSSQRDTWDSGGEDISDLTTSADGLEDLLLRDVTFDHLLPTSTLSSAESADITSANHALPQALPKSVHKALIRPDQVHRLSYLSPARRQVCQDQVDALYYTLKSESPEYEPYSTKHKARQELALEGLESLSRTLRNDIRNWRRTMTLAPDFPISL
ncbi:hypothetical protein MMC11_008978 [Xylographa trunciseda]|nr:hypothetical protein [Xylographa trunciseda]